MEITIFLSNRKEGHLLKEMALPFLTSTFQSEINSP